MEPPASTSTPLLQDTKDVGIPPPQINSSSESEAAEEKKQTHITLQAVSQDGNSLQFKVRMSTPLQKVIDAYCSRLSVDPASVRFLYDGDRVKGENTPEIMHMENGDILDVVLQQSGGGAQ